jgi:hypothetical protein
MEQNLLLLTVYYSQFSSYTFLYPDILHSTTLVNATNQIYRLIPFDSSIRN